MRAVAGVASDIIQSRPKLRLISPTPHSLDVGGMINTGLKRYYRLLDSTWHLVPPWLRSCIFTLSIFVLGTTIKGEWILIFIHLLRQFEHNEDRSSNFTSGTSTSWDPTKLSLEDVRMQNLPITWIACNSLGFAIWIIVGGFLQWYFYINQHDRPKEWKCQPNRWLTPEEERSEFLWGLLSLTVTNTGSAIIACYIINGGYSTVYYNIKDYPLIWYFLQWPVCFFFQDYFTYWAHRIYHMPFLYSKFHKLHHRFKAPTCWSVTAFHPFEIATMQLVLAAPLFFLPVHWTSFTTLGIYIFYNAILDHSGVDIKAPWWQFWKPDSIFHDNHHQYTHVNFGFNCFYWDMIHGTYRKTDRIYREDIYYGHGKPFSEATEDELQGEVRERLAENPAAHRRLRNVLIKS